MPSAKVLEEKKQIVNDMTERLKCKAGVFVDFKGITVVEDTQMRVKMRESDVEYNVIKNSLMKFAIKNVGFDALEDILVGTTSLATSNDDPIAPARIVREFADKMPKYFEIKAGFMDGKIMSAEEVNTIARIPALPVLQAQLLGTMLAPITSLAIVLKAIAEKDGAPSDTDAKATDEAAAVEAPAEAEPAATEEKATETTEETTQTEKVENKEEE
ncbi:MAG: 50S ribosomal protein L10 [Oscillospiraceae bacterium]|jgi:large subunit ribosomal protein L10|nr:50S ribosomal protein L10 [Oscillospiraceae bacterium]